MEQTGPVNLKFYPDLQIGAKGSDVENLQMLLYAASYYHNRPDFNPIEQDGIFGQHTLSALKNFQAALGLPINGVANVEVFAALEAVNASPPGTINFFTTNIRKSPQIPPIMIDEGKSYVLPKPQPIDWTLIGIVSAVLIGIIFFIDTEI